MTRRQSMAVAALLLLAACASEHPAPYDCDVDATARPLGWKVLPFIDWVKSRPQATKDEFSDRDAMLGDDMQRFGAYRRDEADATAEHARDFVVGFGPDCADRVAEIERQLEFHGDRMHEDAHCFFARAWHALKMLE